MCSVFTEINRKKKGAVNVKGIKMMKRQLVYIILVGFVLPVIGCKSGPGAPGRMRSLFANDVTIQVNLPPEGNENTAVAVDFLAIHNQELGEKLMEIDAKTWFAMKNQVKNDFTLGKDYDIIEHEYAPGGFASPVKLPWSSRKTALLIYADYMNPGVHRFRSTQRQELTLTLGEKEFTVVPQK